MFIILCMELVKLDIDQRVYLKMDIDQALSNAQDYDHHFILLTV